MYLAVATAEFLNSFFFLFSRSLGILAEEVAAHRMAGIVQTN